jgi:hypothetical protein
MTDSTYSSERVRQVIRAGQAWLKAHLELDIAALDRLMAAEYLQVNSRGELIPKKQVIASFRSGQRHWEEAESDEYQVRIYGYPKRLKR